MAEVLALILKFHQERSEVAVELGTLFQVAFELRKGSKLHGQVVQHL